MHVLFVRLALLYHHDPWRQHEGNDQIHSPTHLTAPVFSLPAFVLLPSILLSRVLYPRWHTSPLLSSSFFSQLFCSPVISKLPSPPCFSRLNLPLQLSFLHSPGLLAIINSVHHPRNPPHHSPAENMTIFSTGDIQRVNKTVVSASR